MPQFPAVASLLMCLFVLCPLLYGLAAARLIGGSKRSSRIWGGTLMTARAGFVAALSAGMVFFATGARVHVANLAGLAVIGIRVDVLSVLMLMLITFIALIILRYSRNYIDGDAGQARYQRWFLMTLTCVSLLVMADNLWLMALTWIGTSLCLHKLLVFYPERPRAQLAAHKKFLASRMGDLCLLIAIGLLQHQFGSANLDTLLAVARSPGFQAPQAATLLLAIAALIKCAQLPLHGWLIQVMEAPTPVSALLHAGIVNMGGFLMIRLAPLMAPAGSAQTLLVIAGAVTAVLAALIMMTRVSVKVMLAWSTCAQMGFMLMECGLGAYHLALLHLLAHSLYKAHAFLCTGSTVEHWTSRQMLPQRPSSRLGHWLWGSILALAGVLSGCLMAGADLLTHPAWLALALIVALALATQMSQAGMLASWPARVRALLGGLAVGWVYFGWERVFATVTAPLMPPAGHDLVLPALAAAIFLALFIVHAALTLAPDGRFARHIYPHLYGGLYLDEAFTRLTFRIWPPTLPHTRRHTRLARTFAQQEADA